MGRKIPAKKHKGVKDPLKQQAQRNEKLKTKINAPPTDPDEQPIPRSLTRLFAFRDLKEKKSRKKPNRKKSSFDITAEKQHENPVKQLQRLPGEAARAFSLRINCALKQLSQQEDPADYPLDLEENDVKGQRMLAERERRQQKRRKREKEERIARGEPRKRAGEEVAEKSRPHRMDIKKAYRKAKVTEKAAGRAELRYERVQFGATAAAPPALPAPRRARPRPAAPRPGQRELLLSKLLRPPSPAPDPAPSSPSSPSPRAPRPSAAGALDAERRERARLAAVAAYRQLKLDKLKKKNT